MEYWRQMGQRNDEKKKKNRKREKNFENYYIFSKFESY